MTHAAMTSLIGREFDDFLYAAIDDYRNGRLLSVLSALTRLDVDPWQEAAKLARLPKEAATQRLAALIATLPDEPAAHRPAGAIAARLIALLPRAASPTARFRQTRPSARATIFPRPSAPAVMLVLALIALSSLFIRPSSAPSDSAPPPAASGVSKALPSAALIGAPKNR